MSNSIPQSCVEWKAERLVCLKRTIVIVYMQASLLYIDSEFHHLVAALTKSSVCVYIYMYIMNKIMKIPLYTRLFF